MSAPTPTSAPGDTENGRFRASIARVKEFVIGAPRNALARETRHNMALVSFLAWIGLGADGLSSANYGPEEAYIALGSSTHLALYLAAMTAITVFVIGLAYNQVIELFPSGGGGYKVSTALIGPKAGLVSGAALIVDYVLTISISIASGVDAIFSLLPLSWQIGKLPSEIAITFGLLILNLRGVKEPLKLLVPLFLGFLLTHGALIVYGIGVHAERIPELVPQTFSETHELVRHVGWIVFASILLRAFALGGGTYTGIEAVSNNVNMLKEPRVVTGRWTMVYMATSLAFTAAGLIILYLLWDIRPEAGQTLNAVTFHAILAHVFGDGAIPAVILLVVLTFAALLLFVGANTGFLGGPAVLANMGADRWVPHQFSQLSNRLVTQNGVLLMGLAAMAILVLTSGNVDVLVVLYSLNVFLTFSLCIFGLCVYWWGHRMQVNRAGRRLALAVLGFLVSAGILMVTLVEKFTEGAWMTVLITGLVIALCLVIRRHYDNTGKQLAKVDALFATATPAAPVDNPPPLDPQAPTAVFLIGRSLGTGMHTLLASKRLFGGQFKNYVFISVGEVDSESFRAEELLAQMTKDVQQTLDQYVNYCHRRGIAATSFHRFGPDTVEELGKLADDVVKRFPNSVFFASKLLFEDDMPLSFLLHNQTALAMQKRLQSQGVPMVILPMKV
ncbi:MAG TPA: APC family permease [Candidatus Cybelea sp.]|nr:APC family permease [Candidatus Cybelea sp.]